MGVLGNIYDACAIATAVLGFLFPVQRLSVTVAETANDLRVKDSAAVIAVLSVMNGGIARKKERRCEIIEEG